MTRGRTRLSRRHKAWLYAACGLLFATGGLWLVLHFYAGEKNEFGATPHPAESWLMKVHGGAAMLVLVVIGTLLPGHVRRGWKAKKNRFTGAGLLALNGLLILSGYALYYCGSERMRPLISASHWIPGLALPFTLAWHIWQGRRVRQP